MSARHRIHRPASPGRLLAVALAAVVSCGAAQAESPRPAAGAAPAPASTASPAPAPAAAVAVAPAAAADPLVDLRQRLLERLAAAQPSPGAAPAVAPGATLELRLTPRSQPAASGSTSISSQPAVRTSAATRPASGASPRAGAAATAASTTWSYDGSTGPAAWGTLKPEYALCAQGQRQSPIDLQGGLPVDLEPVRFDYRASRFGVLDTGRTLQVNVAGGNHIELGGRRFELKRVQFHHPAEHRIDGRRFALAAHLVHEDAEGRQAVVAVLLDPGPAQPVLQTVWSHIPLEKHQEQAARAGVDFAALLPADRRYYTYMGSATTPPCKEGVQWVVMRTPMTLAPEQLELFARIYPMNARPVQAAAGRRILQSN